MKPAGIKPSRSLPPAAPSGTGPKPPGDAMKSTLKTLKELSAVLVAADKLLTKTRRASNLTIENPEPPHRLPSDR